MSQQNDMTAEGPVSNQIVLIDTQGPELRSWWFCSTLCWSNPTRGTVCNSSSSDLRKTLTIMFTGRKPRMRRRLIKHFFFKELGLLNLKKGDSGERPSFFQSLKHLRLSRAGTKWEAIEERGCLKWPASSLSLEMKKQKLGVEGNIEEKDRDRIEFNYNSSEELPQFCLEHLPPFPANDYSFLSSDCI